MGKIISFFKKKIDSNEPRFRFVSEYDSVRGRLLYFTERRNDLGWGELFGTRFDHRETAYEMFKRIKDNDGLYKKEVLEELY